MTRSVFIPALLVALTLTAQAATAGCYADYKAKRDDPLKLHYGVAQISGACTKQDAKSELKPRLQRANWVLLNVVSVFDASGLEKRKDSAGQFYLRY